MTSTQLIEPTPLTKEDIAAMRKADTFVYFYNQSGEISEYGIRLSRKVKTSKGWSGDSRDERLTIPVSGRIENYSEGRNPVRTAVCLEWTKYADSVSRSIAQIVRAGDILEIRFIADNNTETIRSTGLHMDECWLRIIRGNKVLSFMIDTLLCPNNSARMCQF